MWRQYTQFGDKTQRSNAESHRPATLKNWFHVFVAQTHHKIWISFSHLSLLKCYHTLDLRVAEKNVHWPKIDTQSSLLGANTCGKCNISKITSSPHQPTISNVTKYKKTLGFFLFFSAFSFEKSYVRNENEMRKVGFEQQNGIRTASKNEKRILLWIIIINKDKQLKSTIHINGFIVWAHNFMVGCEARQKNEKELVGVRETEKEWERHRKSHSAERDRKRIWYESGFDSIAWQSIYVYLFLKHCSALTCRCKNRSKPQSDGLSVCLVKLFR